MEQNCLHMHSKGCSIFFFFFWELNKEFLFIIIKKEISNKFLHYPLFVYLNCQSITKQETFMQKGQKRKGTVQRAMIGKSWCFPWREKRKGNVQRAMIGNSWCFPRKETILSKKKQLCQFTYHPRLNIRLTDLNCI